MPAETDAQKIARLEAEITRLKSCDPVFDINSLPNKSKVDSFNYTKFTERVKDISKAQVDGVKESLEELFKHERLKGHEIGQVMGQIISTAMQTSPSIISEAMKLDPDLNPFYQYDVLMKQKEALMADSKVREACSKAELISAQAEGYRVQTRSDIVKLQINGWSTHHAQAKTVSIPEIFQDSNITEGMQELFEMVNQGDKANKAFNYDEVVDKKTVKNPDGTIKKVPVKPSEASGPDDKNN